VFGKECRLPRDYWRILDIHYFARETLRVLRIELQGICSLDFFDRKKRSMIDVVEGVDMK